MLRTRMSWFGIYLPAIVWAKRQGLLCQSRYDLLLLNSEVVLSSHTLTVIPEIFDRLIVAEALRLGLPLITSDSVIRASGAVNVVWD